MSTLERGLLLGVASGTTCLLLMGWEAFSSTRGFLASLSMVVLVGLVRWLPR